LTHLRGLELRTEAQYEELRDRIDEFLAPTGRGAGTICIDWAERFRCPLAFDPYNTDGDCLACK